MDAVRPDHNVRRGRRAVGETNHGAFGVLVQAGALMPGPHRAGRQLGHEQPEQVGPVDADVPSGPGELVRFVPRGPSVGEPELGRQVPRPKPLNSVADPELFQHPQPVGRQRHTGPDLGQLLRLLVHPHVDRGPRQRDRRRGPADPAADDHRPQRHAFRPSSRLRQEAGIPETSRSG